MVVFSEWFPVNEESAVTLTGEKEEQETVDRGGDEVTLHPLQTVYEIPQKRSMKEMIEEFGDDTEKHLRESQEMEAKMSELHQVIENFDKINFLQLFPSSSNCAKKFDEKKFKIAECESILSLDVSEKRVNQLQADELKCEVVPAAPLNAEKANKKIVKTILKKSQFTSSTTTQMKESITKSQSKPITNKPKMPSTVSFIPKVSRTKTFYPNPPPPPSTSIQQILSQAKEKRSKHQNGLQIPVINLKFE
jgi:hypothetical protein